MRKTGGKSGRLLQQEAFGKKKICREVGERYCKENCYPSHLADREGRSEIMGSVHPCGEIPSVGSQPEGDTGCRNTEIAKSKT